jgi:hypothetical protein
MILKCQVVEEELLAEIAPGMRQDLSTLIGWRVTSLNMISERF